jgi:hypothetical protein
MNSVGSHGSSSLPFVMKVMVCHFVSDSHEVMTALIVMLPLIVVVEISLQLHGSLGFVCTGSLPLLSPSSEVFSLLSVCVSGTGVSLCRSGTKRVWSLQIALNQLALNSQLVFGNEGLSV